MRNKINLILLCGIFAAVAGISSCRPRRGYIELGQVWIRPEPRMSRYHVEKKLRKKAARMGADAVVITEDAYSRNRMAYRRYRRGTMIYRERRIGGVAIRFR